MSRQAAARARLLHLFAVRGVRLTAAAMALAVGASAALAWVAQRYAEGVRREAAALRAERDEHRARLQRDGGAQGVQRFAQLRARGLFATGDAVAWAEALTATVAELGLPAPRFEIAAREAAAAEGEGDAPEYAVQRMRFAVDGLHEEEFVRLLDRLAQRSPGPFAVRECRLARAAEGKGLAAECTLRWLVFEPAQRAAAESGSGRS
ncbi:MAG: hypothetical protein OHK0044_33550 [Burkholderiaceae bacterium]